MDIQEALRSVLQWIAQNSTLLVLACVAVVGIFALVLLRRVMRQVGRYFALDRAERAFRRAGVRVPAVKIDELRAEFARGAADTERQRVAAENRQTIELAAIEAEKSRILRLVRSTPAVVREAGEALKAIEREYDQSVRSMRSDQAKEGLRRTAEKQIREILRTVTDDGKNLPAFHMEDPRSEPGIQRRPTGEERSAGS